MAAEALEAEAAEMHIAIKVETNGADGVKNHLTEQEIENAECIIVAADKAVETARFAGKPVLRVPVSQALKDPEMLLHRALSAQLRWNRRMKVCRAWGATVKQAAQRWCCRPAGIWAQALHRPDERRFPHDSLYHRWRYIDCVKLLFWTAVMRAQKCSGGERPLPCWCARLVIPHLI